MYLRKHLFSKEEIFKKCASYMQMIKYLFVHVNLSIIPDIKCLVKYTGYSRP